MPVAQLEAITGALLAKEYSKGNTKTGFSAIVYKDGNNIVISFRGTDTDNSDERNKDLKNDGLMGIKEMY